jgi:hypothetical protein
MSRLFAKIPHKPIPYVKSKIPKALREQVWLVKAGKVFETKCPIAWCTNTINVFNFQCGHNVPESKGGATHIGNLIPLCSRCNVSMGNMYTIDEWNTEFAPPVAPAVPVVPAVESKNCLLASLDRFRYKPPPR